MAEASSKLEGPDFEKGCQIDKVPDEGMLLGHAFGEAILAARRGDDIFAIGATCTHYGGPLSKGLMVDCIVRCPWHHARFDLRTGEAIGAPALSDTSCWNIEKRGERFFVTGKIDKKPARKPKSSPTNSYRTTGRICPKITLRALRRKNGSHCARQIFTASKRSKRSQTHPPAQLIRKGNGSSLQTAARYTMARCCWRPAPSLCGCKLRETICRTFVICELSLTAAGSSRKRKTRSGQLSLAQASSAWK
jgi:nitrite reductase/ring-hydroxylating ferredoxin subunit